MTPGRRTLETAYALAARLLLAIVGGYLFASGAAALVAEGLAAVQLPRAEAAESAALAGLVLYFALFLLAFARWRLRVLGAVFVGGGVLMLCLAAVLA